VNPLFRAAAIDADIETHARTPSGSSTIGFYERNAEDYARSTRALSLEREIDRFCSHLERGARVLDVGCGGGRDLLALREAGMQPTGLELSPKLAEIARSFSDCEVVVGDMRAPPFANGSFDGIWAAASLLHLHRDDVLPTLRRLRSLMAVHGIFFASMKIGLGSERSTDGRQFTFFSQEEWSNLLHQAGWNHVQVEVELPKNAHTGTVWMQSLSRAE
jgi:SAM-dependent methyltransferase